MESLRERWRRWRSIVGRSHIEDGLNEEIRFHLEQQTEKNLRAGMDLRASLVVIVSDFSTSRRRS